MELYIFQILSIRHCIAFNLIHSRSTHSHFFPKILETFSRIFLVLAKKHGIVRIPELETTIVFSSYFIKNMLQILQNFPYIFLEFVFF